MCIHHVSGHSWWWWLPYSFISYKSGLRTRSLGLKTLGTAECPASSHYAHVISLSLNIIMGPRIKVSSENLEKPGIEPTSSGLQGGLLNHYATEASFMYVENIKKKHLQECIILRAKNLAPLLVSIFSGSKLIASFFILSRLCARVERLLLSQIRMYENASKFKGTVLVKNVKSLNFWHKLFLKNTFYPDNYVHLIFMMFQITKQIIIFF